METYPQDKIPVPLLEPFSFDDRDTVLRTQMESARFRQRKRFTKEFYTSTAKFRFSLDQFRIWQSWVYWKINSGADWFLLNMQMGGGNVGDAAFKTFTVRLAAPYKVTRAGDVFDVTVPIETEDPQFMTLTQLNAALV